MAEQKSYDVLNKSMLNMFKSVTRIQQERQKIMLGMFEADQKMGGTLMGKMMEQKIKQQDPMYQMKLKAMQNATQDGQGNYEMSPSGTFSRLSLKDRAERVYQKPQEQWTPQDRQIVGQYRAMTAKDKGPTWKQTQEVDAVKAELRQGRATKFSVSGIPIAEDIKSRQDALDLISAKELSPEMFKEELNAYYPEETPRGSASPELQAKIDQAKEAGYSDEEIQAYLGGQ